MFREILRRETDLGELDGGSGGSHSSDTRGIYVQTRRTSGSD